MNENQIDAADRGLLDTDEPQDVVALPPPAFWTVTVVLADTAYGGPEEGGWYYNTSDPFDPDATTRAAEEKAARVFYAHEEALAYQRELNTKCARWNADERRPRKDSVLSYGVYEAGLFEGWPVAEPATRPHYE